MSDGLLQAHGILRFSSSKKWNSMVTWTGLFSPGAAWGRANRKSDDWRKVAGQRPSPCDSGGAGLNLRTALPLCLD
jgi:hypothetical protein